MNGVESSRWPAILLSCEAASTMKKRGVCFLAYKTEPEDGGASMDPGSRKVQEQDWTRRTSCLVFVLAARGKGARGRKDVGSHGHTLGPVQ